MKTIKLQLEELTCPSCIQRIESALSKQEGVEEAKVLFSSSKVKIGFNEEKTTAEKLISVVESIGYPVLSFK